MAFDKSPASCLPGYQLDGDCISIPLAALPELTVTRADPLVGDIRWVAYALLRALQQKVAESPEQPPAMTLQANDSLGPEATISRSFAVTFAMRSQNLTLAKD